MDRRSAVVGAIDCVAFRRCGAPRRSVTVYGDEAVVPTQRYRLAFEDRLLLNVLKMLVALL
eukprot:57796-Prymnesium_polylepis.2